MRSSQTENVRFLVRLDQAIREDYAEVHAEPRGPISGAGLQSSPALAVALLLRTGERNADGVSHLQDAGETGGLPALSTRRPR